MRVTVRPKPQPGFDENPEWTEADFAVATTGPRRAAEALRDAARALRVQAHRMEREADALAASEPSR